MTSIIKSSGIILKKKKLRETSKIITVFTKDLGKLNLVAKGVRSSKSKLSAILEPINYIDFIYYSKEERDFQYLSGADFINEFKNIKNNFTKLQYSFASLEIIDFFIHPNQPHPDSFELLVNVLELFNNTEISELLIFDLFLFQILRLNGYPVYSHNCPVCNLNLITFNTVYFSKSHGVICEKCREKVYFPVRIDDELRKFIELSCSDAQNEIFNSKLSDIKLKQLLNLYLEFLKNHINEFKGLNSVVL